jgi:hypothetical protein
MYLGPSELGYEAAVAFVAGVDQGSEFLALNAFREYLVLHFGHGNNLGVAIVGIAAPLSSGLHPSAVGR